MVRPPDPAKPNVDLDPIKARTHLMIFETFARLREPSSC